jgi:hypothetical protein
MKPQHPVQYQLWHCQGRCGPILAERFYSQAMREAAYSQVSQWKIRLVYITEDLQLRS